MKKLLAVTSVFFMLISMTCPDEHEFEKELAEQRNLYVVNNSSGHHYLAIGYNYPDTTFVIDRDYFFTTIKPYETCQRMFRISEWPEAERGKVVQLFVVSFDAKTGIVDDSVLARYELTRACFESGDHKAVYPKED